MSTGACSKSVTVLAVDVCVLWGRVTIHWCFALYLLALLSCQSTSLEGCRTTLEFEIKSKSFEFVMCCSFNLWWSSLAF